MPSMPSELDLIRSEIEAHPDNAWAADANYRPLFVADVRARVVVIGQAPGRKAQETGIPWNDPSGDRLLEWIGVDRSTFHDSSVFALLPMDFYYPGKGPNGDLPPRRDFAAQWHPRLLSAMPDVRLKLLVGNYAQRHYLGTRESLTHNVRRYEDYLPGMLPLVHPSPLNFRWLAKNPWYEEDVIPRLREVVAAALA